MGSSTKNKKEKEKEASRKRRHRSPVEEEHGSFRDKRHKRKHKHHKEKKRERSSKQDYESDDSDVVEIIPISDEPRRESKESTRDVGSHKTTKELSTGQGADSLSIEETNQLRATLGLKPLEVGTTTSSKSKNDGKIKDDLGEFYHKPAENWAAKAEQEKLRAKLAEHKEKRLQQTKLSKVKTLGESDSEDDVSKWVDKNRKIETAKKEAEKRAKMLEELDAQFGISEIVETEQRERKQTQYTNKDLKGLRVEHDVDSFADERDVILTLKDKGVLEDEEDILMNVNMVENEKYKKNVDLKKKKILYNPYEDQQYDEFGNLKEKSLLSKYDEEIDGEKRDSFRIGVDNVVAKKQAIQNSIKEKLTKTKLESIGETYMKPMSEYYNEEELTKFKKPKKKVRKIRSKGKLTAEELLPPQHTGIEAIGSRRTKYRTPTDEPDISIDDTPAINIPVNIKIEDDKDDILEKALHKARKIRQKQSVRADFLKTEIKEEAEEEVVDSGNIVLNATAEFCRTLGDIPTYGKSGNRDEDEDMVDFEKELTDDKSDDECEIIEPSGWNSIDPTNQGIDSSQIISQEIPILDEEPDVSTGVGAALKLAMSKGYLDKEESNRPSNSRLAHLQAQHYSIEDKTYGEDNERGRGRERYSGPIMDFREKDGFKPNVKLEYIDDEGHILNSKEAFRYLSHKFHGKGPGKNKIEKRIKKNVQEQLMKKMSSTDTPLGTLNMLQAKQKETQSPFVVLSGSKHQQSAVISKTKG
ncbi:U4/U6.U5 tri-snRNP-associated protein 1 [Cylas formicarius]|uniref:U4/U6.U5 tri-snRNP-associated protein 1 n=1 Tax=Cylas formicarius TaxID=197179 RepID=UPI0029585FD7|nr:U4/U6.U5 tri-snRNP-associated protein 1 [Cylas formicarius]